MPVLLSLLLVPYWLLRVLSRPGSSYCGDKPSSRAPPPWVEPTLYRRARVAQLPYFTLQPYGLVVGGVTDWPAASWLSAWLT